MRRTFALAGVVVAMTACAQSTASSPPPVAHGWTMVAHTRAGRTPGPVVLGGRWAFVANMSDGTVSELDRDSGRVIATVRVADTRVLREQGCAPDSVHAYYSGSWGWRACDTPYAIAWDGSELWALDNGDRMLLGIDPASQKVDRKVQLPGTGWSVAAGDRAIYVSGFADNHALYVIDRSTFAVTTVSDLDTGPASLVADASGVWVGCVRAPQGHLDRIDPTTNRVTGRYAIEWWSSAIVADAGALYVRGTFGGDISRIDAASGGVAWTKPGPGFIGRQGIDQLGAAPDGIWMSGPTTSRIDAASGDVVETIPIASESVAAAEREVWIVELDGSVAKYRLK